MLQCFEKLSELWGGAGAIAVPWANGAITPAFENILRAYDPDVVVSFRSDSSRGTDLPDTVTATIQRLTSTFDQRRQPPIPTITPNQQHLWPPSLIDCDAKTPLSYIDIRLDNDSPEDLELLIAFRYGRLSSFHRDQLQSPSPVHSINLSIDDCLDADIIEAHFFGRLLHLRGSWALPPRLKTHLRGKPNRLDELDYRSLKRFTPLGHTMLGCDWYPHTEPRWSYQVVEDAAIVVVGDSLSDFCLALCLDRMYQNAAWLPSMLLNDRRLSRSSLGVIADQVSRIARGDIYVDIPVALTSMSVEPSHIRNILRRLRRKGAQWPRGSVRIESAENLRLSNPRRLLDREHVEEERFVAFDGARAVEEFEGPSPSDVIAKHIHRFGWITDVVIDRTLYPRRRELATHMTEGWEDVTLTRVSDAGVAYWPHVMASVFGTKKDTAFPFRPRFRFPDGYETFKTMLESDGLRGTLSDKGCYQQGVISLWSDFPTLIRDLNDRTTARLLDAYKADSRTDAFDLKPAKETPHRRILNLAQVRKITKLNIDGAMQLVERLAGLGAMSSGWYLKCSRCLFSGWYPFEDIAATFRCQRCRAEELIRREHWAHAAPKSSAPDLYYRLDEVVFQFVTHGGPLVAKAAEHCRGRSHSFLLSPEMTIEDGGSFACEVDLLAVIDGRTYLGDVKKVGDLGDNSKRRKWVAAMDRVSSAIRPDVIVLASGNGVWKTESKKAAKSVAAKHGAELQLVKINTRG